MTEQTLRAQLDASFRNRALIYLEVYRVLTEELGAKRAEALLKKAIYRRGCAIGEQFRRYGPDDLAGLREAFLAFIPDNGRVFEPQVVHADETRLEIQLCRCPLKEAWKDAGLSDDEIATMCRIAGIVDNGTFEGAGFRFHSATWSAGRQGCCRLFIEKGAAA
jgi:L-2-amino-thiazoline-4-carboxylic acid hydrolase